MIFRLTRALSQTAAARTPADSRGAVPQSVSPAPPPLQVLAISERQQDAYQAEQDRKDRLAKARKRDQMMAALANSPLEVRCHLPRGGGEARASQKGSLISRFFVSRHLILGILPLCLKNLVLWSKIHHTFSKETNLL